MIMLYNATLVKACDVHYIKGPVPKTGIVHCHIWNIDKLIANLDRDIILCTSMGDWSLEQHGDTIYCRAGRDYRFKFQLPNNIKKWFTYHAQTTDPRIIGVPCGLMESGVENLLKVEQEDIDKYDDKLMYVNFTTNTNVLRPNLMKHYMNTSWTTTNMPVHGDSLKYYRNMKSHHFTLCPPGNGVDAYRTWEALHMDSIPVVQTGAHHHFDMFPMVRVPFLDKITPEYLKEFLNSKQNFKINHDYLQEEFWIEKVRKCQLV